jgi:hypothetical protein
MSGDGNAGQGLRAAIAARNFFFEIYHKLDVKLFPDLLTNQ